MLRGSAVQTVSTPAGRSELGAALTDGMDVVTLLANRLRLHDAAMRAPPQRPTTDDDAAEEVRYTERRMGPAALMCPDSFVDRGTIFGKKLC